MVAKSFINGNEIEYETEDEDGYSDRYTNDKELIKRDGNKVLNTRPCPSCNKLPTKDGYDACLGKLPGVSFACCGHGVNQGYITFNDGTTVRFPELTVEKEGKHGRDIRKKSSILQNKGRISSSRG